MRPWSDRPIHENGEALVALPPALLRRLHPMSQPVPPTAPVRIPFSCVPVLWSVF